MEDLSHDQKHVFCFFSFFFFVFFLTMRVGVRKAIGSASKMKTFTGAAFLHAVDYTNDKSRTHWRTHFKFIRFIIRNRRDRRRHVERNPPVSFRFVKINVRLNGSYHKSGEKARSASCESTYLFPREAISRFLTYKKCVKRKAQAGARAWWILTRRRDRCQILSAWISA